MKKIITLLGVFGVILFSSCTGPEGPPGYDGLNGLDGQDGLIGEVLEVTTSFNSGNNYSKIVTFNPAIFSSDVVLVYHLYKVVNGEDVWRPMPQTYYLTNGDEIDYNFDFTRNDVNIFMGANFALTSIPSGWSQNQTFRIVIVPASFATSVDVSNYSIVMNALNKTDSQIQKINF